jgi:pyruvate dehydrogenase E1 component
LTFESPTGNFCASKCSKKRAGSIVLARSVSARERPSQQDLSMSDKQLKKQPLDIDPLETQEWIESLEYALLKHGPDRVRYLIDRMEDHALLTNVEIPFNANTPYINTIPVDKQPAYPSDREIERR